MTKDSDFNFEDLQGLLRFGHGRLTETCFLLLNITNLHAAKQWLLTAPISSALAIDPPPDTALQIAFSVAGLRALQLQESIIEGFSDEFIVGMAEDSHRSRRLGDIGDNAPDNWQWGGNSNESIVPHILLLLYAKKGALNSWRNSVEDSTFSKAFQVQLQLPTLHIGAVEPFGFVDGVSQPIIDWQQSQSTDHHERDSYSNLLATGEVVLGHRNEYGQYTMRPLIDPEQDPLAGAELPDAEDQPAWKDLGRNGTYLVFRQLDQDVAGFWRFLNSDLEPDKRDELAAAMVGRERDGTPLISGNTTEGAQTNGINQFDFEQDPKGNQCPIGAHIRRANPRTGDLPAGVSGIVSRLIRILGFGSDPEEDLIASTRFHRLLRRGRSYGPAIPPEDAAKSDDSLEHGLEFICLVGNISRQFEFVQNAWIASSKFGGVQEEGDPLLGNREPLMSGKSTAHFNRPNASGPMQKTQNLPRFVTVRGGGYFFMPSLSAIRYIANLPVD